MDTKKAVPLDHIQVKILELNNDTFSQYLSQIFNENIEKANFPNELKYADITPVYKKSKYENENYRPVSIMLYPKYSNIVFLIKSIKTRAMHEIYIKWATEREKTLNIH